MASTLQLVQIIAGILLIVLVLVQRSQGDMGASSGSDNASFAHTRRGAEKFIFFLTVIVAIIFVAASIISIGK